MLRIVFVTICLLLIPIKTVMANHAYAVVDGENGRFLFGQNEVMQLPIASLTKVWTALVVIENSELDEIVHISKEASLAEGSLLYLKENDQWTVEQLLYGLMLRSGNDAAWALAEHVGGSVEGFVRLMNDKAELHGLTETRFMNPSGLPHTEHLSSAYDMGKMMMLAMRNEKFRKIASTVVYADETIHWSNKHKLLGHDGAVAGKTGYTKAAGRTLVTDFQVDARHFIVVTLNVANDWAVHRQLAEEVVKNYEWVMLLKPQVYRMGLERVLLDSDVGLLLRPDEIEQLRYFLQIWPDRSRSVLHVYVGEERLLSRAVRLQ